MSIKKKEPGKAQLFEGPLWQIRVKFSFKLFSFLACCSNCLKASSSIFSLEHLLMKL